MALTETPPTRQAGTSPAHEPGARPTRRPLAQPLPGAPASLDRIAWPVAAIVAATWAVIIPLTFAIEPAPADPEAAIPAYASLLSFGLFLALGTMAVGLISRSRSGLIASAVAATTWMAMAIACPVSGHHTFASWWFGEMAGGIILVAVSFGALHLTSRRHLQH
jgi:hypothetical protein